jgi:protein TonB
MQRNNPVAALHNETRHNRFSLPTLFGKAKHGTPLYTRGQPDFGRPVRLVDLSQVIMNIFGHWRLIHQALAAIIFMSQRDRFAPVGGVSRNAVIVGSVVMLHVAGLWALQSGLLRRAAEVIVPAELLSEFIAPPAAPGSRPRATNPSRPAAATARAQGAGPAPGADARGHCRSHTGPQCTGGHHHAPTARAPHRSPGGTSLPRPPAPPAPPAPPRIELPSSDAAYLNNPKPGYPAISKRMGEQGKVVLRVLIGTDGLPQKVEINNPAATTVWTARPRRPSCAGASCPASATACQRPCGTWCPSILFSNNRTTV